MKLQNRDLSLRMTGTDVQLLHAEFVLIGIAIAEDEVREATFGPRTEAVVKAFQTAQGLRSTGIVDEPTAVLINREVDRRATRTSPFLVKGHIHDTSGQPFTAGTVKAFDKDLRSEGLLGEATPDARGYYEIRYASKQFSRPEKQAADLIVRIYGADRAQRFSSEVIFNASPVQTVDIKLDEAKRLSEFERHMAQIKPLLQTLAMVDLTEADIDFIAQQTGIEHVQVAFLVVAHQHELPTRIGPEFFYGLFRQDLPSHLPALLLKTPRALRAALVSSVQDALIPTLDAAAIDAAIAALKRQVSEQLLSDPRGGEVAPRLLRAAGLTPAEQDTFLASYLAHEGSLDSFWSAQRASGLAGKVQALQGTLQLGVVTLNNLPLVEALQARDVRSPADIARLSRRELEEIISGSAEILAAIAADNATETAAQKAARTTEGIFELLHATRPTAFVRAAYDKTTDPVRLDVARVLANAPQFELRDAHIDDFLADNPGALTGVTNLDATKTHLLRVQRALRVAPHAEHAEVLMASGLDSAQAIVSMSPSAFTEAFADQLGGPAQAMQYHQKAKQVNASVLAIAAAVKQSFAGSLPGVIEPVSESIKTLPNFTKLFGSQSACACGHCGSVLSPAAYLVELLDFLNPKFGSKPITRLRQKRPDLEHILLTCENTNTPLPYVDLVNEVLEHYVANQSLSPAAAHNTVGMTAEELSVSPQYVIDAAYDTLGQAVYPPSLPLQRALNLTRAHLTRLGASRYEMMRTFDTGAGGGADIDLEYLEISAFERAILLGTSGRPLAEFYGYPPAQNPDAKIEIKLADFLQRTALTYADLIALLATRFLNPSGTIGLEDDQNPPGCDLTKTTLRNLSAEFWQKSHRFLRLQRKLGWSIADLDLAARAFGATDVTVELLRSIAIAQQLKNDLQIPLEVLLSFWGDLDPAPESLYARLFLNKTLQNPPHPAFMPGTPESASALLQDHLPTIRAALRISDEDLAALRAHLGLAEPQTGPSIANLSTLHRYAALGRALHLSVTDVLSLVALQGSNPFVAADARATRQFIEAASQVKASGFSIALLDYLYRHISDGDNFVLVPADKLRLLRELRTGLRTILAQADESQPAALLLLQQDFVAQVLSEPLGISQRAVHLLLQTQFPAFLSLADLVDDVSLPLPETTNSAFIRLRKASLLVSTFGINDDELAFLITNGADFSDLDFNALPLGTADFQPTQVAQWRRLAALFALRNGMPASQATLIGVFTAASSGAPDARQQAINALAAATKWSAQEIAFLVSPQGFDLSSADDFRNEVNLVPLRACIELSRRLGISCERLMSWASVEPTAVAASDLVSAVKAKYTDEQWLAVAKPISDSLRDAQKSALVGYVLANDPNVKQAGITDGNQLFEYFLIDVQMCSCMNTSRIKQAISSVHLFVQRCLMNLEPGVSPSVIDAERWQWMKNYRVWEANRKVFLYPENWIEPELRDGKSPFFAELENELLQNDLNPEVAERSFVHYLEKLDQVGQLEICGMYVDKSAPAGNGEAVHVFGRTRTTPRVHFHRRLIDGRTWTPWQKLDIEIEGNHLVPVVHNRRLYLFWLRFEERQDQSQQLPHTYIQSSENWKWLNEDYPAWQTAHAKWSRQHEGWTLWNNLKAKEQAGFSIGEMKSAIEAVYEIVLDSDEDSEPRKPEEPAFSAPPPLTHWAIKLGWSEYRDGAWSGKHESLEWVQSPHVATSLQDKFAPAGFLGLLMLGSYTDVYRVMPPSIGGGYDETIFSVYLPKADEHFLRTSIDEATGDVRLKVFRRYSTTVPVLDAPPLEVQGHDSLGWFSLQCGNKAHARSNLQGMDYKSLPRPRETENNAMSFQHLRNVTRKLTFNDDGNVQHILKNLPGSGDFELLYEHQRSRFRLKPPFQHFFYQDGFKTYFVHDDDGKPTLSIENPDFAQIAGTPLFDSPAVIAAKPKKRQLKSSSVQFQQSVSLAVSPAPISAEPGESFALASAPYATAGANGALQLIQDGAVKAVASHKGLRFETFFHPHVCEFIERLYRSGVPALLSRDTQRLDKDGALPGLVFKSLYDPSEMVDSDHPREHVDFDQGAYATYNWELFFHVPMLIATSLTQNQRFEEALRWYHYIFNPTTNDGTPSLQRYWNTLPFFDNAHPEKEQVQQMLLTLAGKKPGWSKIQAQIDAWLADPFNPHLIARMRITAYQKNVVMKYIDNLVAWADQLFGRDTLESINEASLLYVLAYNILGPRPKTVASHTTSEPKTYQQIAGDLDAFANALVEAENLVPYKAGVNFSWNAQPGGKGATTAAVSSSAVQSLYFCIPQNAEMLAYWDKVDDRLFKIRNCMSLDGVRRDLPLFEPPIDPALLVKARAAGVDLGSVLNELTAPLPHYRFNILLQKALEMCGEVKSLGGSLLSALEKRDGEALSNLRATQETALLKVISAVKRQQIDEAKANIEALRRTRRVTETRYSYYRDIERISEHEQSRMDNLSLAYAFNQTSQALQAVASAAFYIPTFTTGGSGPCSSPVTTVSYGGSTIAPGLQSGATIASMVAAAYSHGAMMAEVSAGHDRRWKEWKLQESLASKELDQLDKQIAAAEIRQAITEKELENHQQQIENSAAVEQFMRSKFTNQDLFGWMTTQLSKLYFQAYKLATDLAKRAERTYRHELGVANSSFIQSGLWDSLKKGLLVGEQLALDLKRLDTAYLNQNKREYELTKHMSLLQLSPMALLQLRTTGHCTVNLPEELFDMDGPGHYFRRLKSVALTIPCVAGAYTSVNCTLTLLKSTVRTQPLLSGGSYPRQADEDIRFVDSLGAVQAMVTSTAQSDSGLFEANLRDERYLPFEYAGAVSQWQLELPANPANGDPASFDYDTISDVILTLRYTAREGGALLRQGALDNLKTGIQNASVAGTTRLFSVRHEFPTEWSRFRGQVPGENQRFELSVNLRAEHYPFWSQGLLNSVARVEVLLRSSAEPVPANITVFGVADKGAANQPQDTLVKNPNLGDVLSGQFSAGTGGIGLPETPITALKLCFDDWAMSDLWIAITWSGATGLSHF